MSSFQQKLTKHTKKQENMGHSQEKIELAEIFPEKAQTLDLTTQSKHIKDIKL